MRRGPLILMPVIALRWIVSKRHGMLAFALKTVVFTILCNMVAVGFSTAMGLELYPPVEPAAEFAIFSLIAAPLIENAVMIALAELTRLLDQRPWLPVAVVALFAFATHATMGIPFGITAGFAFAMMTFSYFVWSDRTLLARYFITILQHVLLNIPAVLLAATDP